MYYRLQNGRPVPVDGSDWAAFFDTEDRQVDRTEALPGIWVSTVFLGLDHSFREGPPVLWESMVFDVCDQLDAQRRYCSLGAAKQGHHEMVAWVRSTEDAGIDYNLRACRSAKRAPAAEEHRTRMDRLVEMGFGATTESRPIDPGIDEDCRHLSDRLFGRDVQH